MDEDTKLIKEYIDKLPDTLKSFVLSSVWTDKLNQIDETNQLSDSQAGALRGEVFLVLCGIENISDFKANTQTNVPGLTGLKLTVVCAAIEKEIFQNHRVYLQDLEKKNKNQDESEQKEGNKSEEVHPDKGTVLNEIENPTPAIPRNINPILDAQHELPASHTTQKVVVSSAVVSLKGPMLSNFKPGFGTFPNSTASKMPEITPATSSSPIKHATPVTPNPPPVPQKYTVDPYREPLQ